MIKVNYQKELDKLIDSFQGEVKSVVLHSCCAPCSSYCVEYLSEHFDIMVLFYNPNIYPREEYFRRVSEQKDFLKKMMSKNKIDFIEGDYDTNSFFNNSSSRAVEQEGGRACKNCYRFRLKRAAEVALEIGYDYFATTLSISPHKNSQDINKIGEEVAEEIGISHLPSDFKKKNGYKRSVEISRDMGLYRQDYCGCVFSKYERDKRLDAIEKTLEENKNSTVVVTGCCDDCRHRSVEVITSN